MKHSYSEKIIILSIIFFSQFIFIKTYPMERISNMISLISNMKTIDSINYKIATSFTDFLQTYEGYVTLKYILNSKNIDQLFSLKSGLIKSQEKKKIINRNKIEWIDRISNRYTQPEQILKFIYQKKIPGINSIPRNTREKVMILLNEGVLHEIHITIKKLLDKKIINSQFLIKIIKFFKKNIVFFVEINYLLQGLNLVKKAKKTKLNDFEKKFSKFNLNRLNKYSKKYTLITSFKALTKTKTNLSNLLHLEIKRSLYKILRKNGFIFIEELPYKSQYPKTTPLEKFTWKKFILHDYLKIHTHKYMTEFLNLLAYLFNNEQLIKHLIN